MKSVFVKLTAFLFAFCFLFTEQTKAEGISLIQDAEIESVLKSYIKPMFVLNGLPADSVKIILVKDNSINAFATSGYRVFVHTGLITSADSADEVMGVLAHETGHIAGGHLIRLYDNVKIASATSLVSMILGAAVGVLSGRPDVGVAVMMGGSGAAMAAHSRYRQSEENAADEMAVKTLHKSGYSVKGLMQVMKRLIDQEKISLNPDYRGYLRTHPLTEDRAKFLNNALLNEKNIKNVPQKNEADFQRIKAKLQAFLYPPNKVKMIYRKNDTSFPARYANVIADFRMGLLDEALRQLDEMIKENPADAYLYELKGQALFENGRIKESVGEYKKAVKYAEDEPLIHLGLAFALVETGEEELRKEALPHLEKIVRQDKNNAQAWRLMSIVYASENNMGMTYYCMAEYNLLLGDYENAKDYAAKAKIKLKPDTSRYIKLLDLVSEIEILSAS